METATTEATEQTTTETPAAEVESASTQETEHDETNDGDSETQGSDNPESEENPGDEQEGATPKVSSAEKRIKKLLRREAEAKREAQRWREEFLNATQRQSNRPEQEAPPAKNGDRPTADDFESEEEYQEALIDWKVEQRLQKRDEKAQQQTASEKQQQIAQAWEERRVAFASKTPDFQEVIDAFDDEYEDTPIPNALGQEILRSELGPQVIYELAKKPKEALRIIALAEKDLNAAIKEIGKVEARIESSKSTTTTQPKKTTSAAPPVSPVQGGTNGTTKKPSEMTQAQYEDYRIKQMEASRRRR